MTTEFFFPFFLAVVVVVVVVVVVAVVWPVLSWDFAVLARSFVSESRCFAVVARRVAV